MLSVVTSYRSAFSAWPIWWDTVPFGTSNVSFGSASKPTRSHSDVPKTDLKLKADLELNENLNCFGRHD